ncbi:hypothetical protein MUP05_04490 [Candidatus Bathyarchaeota archaeon]|nr:hypothetical protein [Candidatus Bathyarchaeota archaeon]
MVHRVGARASSSFGALFEFIPLPSWFLSLILGILLVYFLLVEMMKHIFFSRYGV